MSESLYQLSTDFQAIYDELAENGGEITPEIEAKLDALALPFNQKVNGISCWMKNLEGREVALDAEISRLQARKKATENHRERLKSYLLEFMIWAKKDRVELEAFTISVQRNPPSCVIEDEKSIPAKFLTIIPESKQVDKKAVLAALKAGEKVDGAQLATEKYHLRVR